MLLIAYVRRRRPAHNLRKLPSRAIKATNNLVSNLWTESQRKLATRSIATYARGMGALTLPTIQEIVVSMTRTEQRHPVFTPPRKVERNPILQSKISRS